jgi:hypothetical protein
VLFECITGQVAFAGSNPLAVRAKALVMDPPPVGELAPFEVPSALADLVARMLSKDPGARPPDAAAVEQELAALLHIPETAPVRRAMDDSQTLQVRRSRHAVTTEDFQPLVAVILGAVPEDYARPASSDREQAADLEARLARVAASYGARVEMLAGHSTMLVVSGSPEASPPAQAAQAARCALAVRAAAPELALVLTIGDDAGVPLAIDRGARTMELAVRRAILDRGLAERAADTGAIRLDPYAAALLEGEFSVTQHDPKTFSLDGLKQPA